MIIRKRVNLDFLGEEYKDSYLYLKALAVKEYPALQAEIDKVEKDQAQALPFIVEQIKSRFLDGKVEGKDITAEDLDDFSADVFMECFSQIRGNISPKA